MQKSCPINDHNILLTGTVWALRTSLLEWLHQAKKVVVICMCIKSVDFASVSTIYSIRIWNDFDSVVFFVFYFITLNFPDKVIPEKKNIVRNNFLKYDIDYDIN
jgi:hypothetical protein